MHKLIMDAPARDFTESLILGNGRLGACVYGELLREQIVLNETGVWSGSREDADRPGASDFLPEIRRLLRAGRNFEAQQLFSEHFTCLGEGTCEAHGTIVPYGCYQTLGRLLISHFQAASTGRVTMTEAQSYRRVLDLEKAVGEVSFTSWDMRFKREYLVSRDLQCICIRLTCDTPGQINAAVGLDRDERFDVAPLTDIPGLCMTVQLTDGKGGDGVKAVCMAGVVTKGGCTVQERLRVRVCDADEAYIFVTARTDMADFMGLTGEDPHAACLADLQKAMATPWAEILRLHENWYKPQYSRMSLRLPGDDRIATTRELLREAAEQGASPALITLYLNYARYQMICCSQEDSLPANLQGLWSDEILTPWNGDWHLNAQQMIYWLVERANLSECHVPYLKLTEALVEPGRKTAQTYYGARGWLAHTCTNPWGFTSPCENAAWGSTTGSPAWQCHHLWEHYLYTLDEVYLRWAYPIMQEAMLFYMDNMVEDARGLLVTSPSSSPENWSLDEAGNRCALCEGPAYDRALVTALADACLKAAEILQDDSAFTAELTALRPRIAPVEIAPDGRILEFDKPYPEPYPYHRHLSHLWGVFPGDQITVEDTPDFAAAAMKSLVGRGMTTAGWAISYRAALYARLRDGEMAMHCFNAAMKYATAWNMMNLAYHCDETLVDPPLIDLEHCRYPFQIDGNQGTAAALLLMLLDDRIDLTAEGPIVHLYPLPALPDCLPEGRITGLKAKGGVTVDLTWKGGSLTDLHYDAPEGVTVIIH